MNFVRNEKVRSIIKCNYVKVYILPGSTCNSCFINYDISVVMGKVNEMMFLLTKPMYYKLVCSILYIGGILTVKMV